VRTFASYAERVYPTAFTERTAMPSHVDVGRARDRLLQERERLQSIKDGLSGEPGEGVSERDALSELSLADQHPADIGTEVFEQEKDLSIAEQIGAELADVERALKRVDEGTYGVCEACGREIDPERLEARPEARFCVDDQALAERETHAS
jgi:DnaK suppressor protein